MSPKPSFAARLIFRVASRGTAHVVVPAALAAIAVVAAGTSMLHRGPPASAVLPGDTIVIYGPQRFDAPLAGPDDSRQVVHEFPDSFTVRVMPRHRYVVRVTNGEPDGSARVVSGTVEGVTVDAATAVKTFEVAVRSPHVLLVSLVGQPQPGHLTVEVLEIAGGKFLVFGMERLSRGTGPAVTFTRTFTIGPSAGAPFALWVVNGQADGAGRLSGVTIGLNGETIIGGPPQSCPSGGCGTAELTTGTGVVVQSVALVQGRNQISITLPKQPPGFIEVGVTATDITPPTLTVATPAPGFITRDTAVTVTGTVTDASPVAVTVNGVVAARSGPTYSATVPLVEGYNLLSISAVDTRGAQADSTRTVMRDRHAPILTLSAPADGFVTNRAMITVAGTVTDLTAVTVNANGVPLPVDASGAFSGSAPLGEGASVVTVTAADAAGNTSTVVRTGTRATQALSPNLASLMTGITHTLLTSGTNATNQNVYTTASIAPAPNALITVAVLAHRSTGAQTPTVTGGGMASWTLVANVDYDPISGPLSRVAVFRALSSAPGSGPLTISYANSQSNATWIVSQWSGVDLSGANGAGAIVQSGSTRGDAVTSLSKALSAFGNATNVAYGVVGVRMNGPAVTPGSGFAEIAEPTSGENSLLEAEWGVNLPTVSASWTSAKNAGLLAIEIKAAGGGASAITHTLLTSGTNATNQTVYTTASIAPAANALITVAVLGHRESGAQTPTVTGGGMASWTLVASVDYNPIAGPLSRIAVFRALSSAPGSGPLTITYSGNQANATWIVSQWSGVDVSGVNGAGAIVQIATARGDAVSTLSKTLAAFANGNDVAYGVVGAGLNGPAVTPGSGFTEIAEPSSGENNVLEAQWRVNLPTVSASFTAANNAGLLAFEIKAGGGIPGGVFASQSTITASPTSVPVGSGTSTITVTAKDASGNPVSGATVVLAATGGGNTLTQPSGPTNASGVATGTLSSTFAETKTVSATANGIAITQTASVTVTPAPGAIAHTLLTSGTNATNQTVYTTASIAPAANALITVAVLGHRESGAQTPTVTGGGMASWALVASVDYNPIGGPLSRVAVFRAMSSAPGSGPLTITYSGNQSNATWIVSQWSGVDVSGANGAGAIVQIATARGDAVSTLSKTLAAFANGNDVAYGVVGAGHNGPAVTPGGGFTEIAEPSSGENSLLEAQWGVNLPTVSASFTAANNAGLLAFEIKAGGGVGGVFASQSTVTASPTSIPAGSGTSTITVTAKDAGGNPVSGATVVLAATGGGNTLTQPSGPTNASGVATGTLSSTFAETKTVSATANGIAITQTATVTVTPTAGAIAHTLLTSGANATNQTVYTTASIAPAANALITVAVLGHRESGAQTPTVTGGGMASWTLVASVDYNPIGGPLSRVAVFRAMSSAPGSGPLTITYSGNQANATWIVSQWSGVDVSGVNGAGAIVQIATARGDAVSTLSKTLAAFANGNDVAYGVVGAGLNGPAVTPGSGFGEIAEPSSGENNVLEAQWRVNFPTVSASFTAANNAGLLAFEIKAGGGIPGGVFASQSTITASPTSVPVGSGTSTITVTAKDAGGNPVSGATVVLAATGGGNTLTQPSGPTNASGVATGTLSSTFAETKTVSATANGIAITQTASVTFTAPSGSITHTLLTAGTNTTNQTVYTTASIAPVANALITVAVLAHRSTGAQTPTVTGGGMSTWTLVASVDYDPISGPLSRVAVFRALSSAPGSGPLTITYANNQSNATWIVSQWSGVDVSGVNGAGAIVQSGSTRGDAVTSLSKSLSAFGNATNVAYGVVGVRMNGPAVTPGSGFAEIAEPTSGENSLLEAEWGVNLPTVSASWTSAKNAGLLAIEIKAGGGGEPPLAPPPINPTVATTMASATEFLYTGSNPVQTGVAPGTIEPLRVAVLRGRVLDRGEQLLPGVTVRVKDHPELGQTLSRADGRFDLAVNGGGVLTVDYTKSGYLPAQRQVSAPWQDYEIVDDVVLVPVDAQVTVIDFSDPVEVARGSVVMDADGTRRTTALFFQGTTAQMVLPGGGTQPLSSLSVRATEYTVGANGPEAMPALLPPTSGYTYAVELSADEAIAAGATSVQFSQPVATYVENFLNFPVGLPVPVGSYDRVKGAWVPEPNGRIIKIVAITAGSADLDIDGDGVADDATELAALGVTPAERQTLAGLYTSGQSLWRMPVTHFTPIDGNYPIGPPDDAEDPPPPDGGGGGGTPRRKGKRVDDPCLQNRSIIECQNQVLGERIAVTGTPFTLNYRSDRVAGFSAGSIVNVQVTRSTSPGSLLRAEVRVQVAGRDTTVTFAPAPNVRFSYVWDGRDAYGRLVSGEQRAQVTVTHVYPQVFLIPAEQAQAFGLYCDGRIIGGLLACNIGGPSPTREVTLTRRSEAELGPITAWNAVAQGMGGWSLDVHHAYDPPGRLIYFGSGERVDARDIRSATVVAGNGTLVSGGDGGPATAAGFADIADAVAAPDGGFYVADGGAHTVRRVRPDGIIQAVAGVSGSPGSSGDGGPATAARLNTPVSLALGSDGSVYIADKGNARVRRVAPSGTIETFAGTGSPVFSGDGGPATAAGLVNPAAVTAAPDGSVYIADVGDTARVRKVSTDGRIVTIAGAGRDAARCGADSIPADELCLSQLTDLTWGPDDALYLLQGPQLRKIGTDGVATHVAGALGINCTTDPGDGGLAKAAGLCATSVAVASSGQVFLADHDDRVRVVEPDGTIARFGSGRCALEGPIEVVLASAVPMLPALPAQSGTRCLWTVALWADGALLVTDPDSGRISRIQPALPGLSLSTFVVAAPDGGELYLFSAAGRHLETRDALTGATLLTFGYAADGSLSTVTDANGNVTTIERDGQGRATAIVAPFGQRTAFAHDGNGFLASVANPGGETFLVTHDAEGLLRHVVTPRGDTTRFTYEGQGLFTREDDPAGGFVTLERDTVITTFRSYDSTLVTLTTAAGRVTRYEVAQEGSRQARRTVSPAGLAVSADIAPNAGKGLVTTRTLTPDATVTTVITRRDPRFPAAAVLDSLEIKTPSQLVGAVTASRTVALANPDDPLSLVTQTDSVSLNGNTTVSTYTASTRRQVVTTPEGRQFVTRLDAQGRVVAARTANLDSVMFTYDTRGRLGEQRQGGRVVTYGYHPTSGRLTSVTDPLGRVTQFGYDSAGRVTRQTRPDGRDIMFDYDPNGNLATLTPPGRPEHGFQYTAVGLVRQYDPPGIPGPKPTRYFYNLDRQLDSLVRPDSIKVALAYDAAGRPQAVTFDRGTLTLGYSPTTGNLTRIRTPTGDSLTFSYDGSLPTEVRWVGAVNGRVGVSYDPDFRVATQTVNGANPVGFIYDRDGLLTRAGALMLGRSATNGLLLADTLGPVRGSYQYTSRGELKGYRLVRGGTTLFATGYTRDSLGRIVQLFDTTQGTPTRWSFVYDNVGRLVEDSVNGAVFHVFTYDDNGNRLSFTSSSGTVNYVYDAQDRLLSAGTTTYTYGSNGELKTKTVPGVGTTTYTYDALGNLVTVVLPNGTQIQYVIDGQNRRVGRKVNGVLVQAWLYQNQLNPVAELDGTGNVVSRFVYGTRMNVPDYLVKSGVTYRLISDHLGSVRLVVDTATGAVAQRIDYDEWGNVSQNTNPGFQPFGFAGGLYDGQSGLVRFGVRDHDPAIGRWMTKDPLLFVGGGANLYRYVLSDPVNLTDPAGLAPCGCPSGLSAAAGGALGAGLGTEYATRFEMRTDPFGQAKFGYEDPRMRHGWARTAHFDGSPKVGDYHFNADVGPLRRWNHTPIPEWGYRLGSVRVIRAAGRTLGGAGLALDAVNILTAGDCEVGAAIGGAVGGLGGAGVGALIGSGLLPGPGTIIGGIIGGILGGLGGEAVGARY